MNTETEIYIALRDHLLTFANLPFVAFPMETYDPPLDPNGLPSLFWVVNDLRLPVRTRFVGATDPDNYTGSFQVHIKAPARITHAQLMQSVGDVVNHFPKGTCIGGIKLTGTPFLGSEPYQDGIYTRAPVIVPWLMVA